MDRYGLTHLTVKCQTCGKRSQGWSLKRLRVCKWYRNSSGGLKLCKLDDDESDDYDYDYDDDGLCRILNYEQSQ